MNHRQWKKKFKKVHGRAPYPWEDKRVVRKTIICSFTGMYEAISNITKTFAEALVDAAEALSDVFANMADALRRN